MEAIIVAVITGIFTVLSVIITNNNGNKTIKHQIEVQQAVTDCKIEELTREVREHNNFAHRMPVVEEQIKILNREIEGLKKAQR